MLNERTIDYPWFSILWFHSCRLQTHNVTSSLGLRNGQTNELFSIENVWHHFCLDFVATEVEDWREANYFPA